MTSGAGQSAFLTGSDVFDGTELDSFRVRAQNRSYTNKVPPSL
jgi:hypothetical protein